MAKDDYPLARIQAKASLVAMGKRPKIEAKKMETEDVNEETTE